LPLVRPHFQGQGQDHIERHLPGAINTSLYLCDNKFHTEALSALLADDNRFGFIVMDGNGALFGTLQVMKTTFKDV
jgi:peptide subunit release factor 1 (eRF1)